MKNANNELPLSVALGLSASQLAWLGEKSETLSGEVLKKEVTNNPDFEKLKNLSAQELNLISHLVNIGKDPVVSVNDADEIYMSLKKA